MYLHIKVNGTTPDLENLVQVPLLTNWWLGAQPCPSQSLKFFFHNGEALSPPCRISKAPLVLTAETYRAGGSTASPGLGAGGSAGPPAAHQPALGCLYGHGAAGFCSAHFRNLRGGHHGPLPPCSSSGNNVATSKGFGRRLKAPRGPSRFRRGPAARLTSQGSTLPRQAQNTPSVPHIRAAPAPFVLKCDPLGR